LKKKLIHIPKATNFEDILEKLIHQVRFSSWLKIIIKFHKIEVNSISFTLVYTFLAMRHVEMVKVAVQEINPKN
jgi:hypothetical protein